MDLQEVLKQRSFAVVGDTQKEEKYAYKIKQSLLERGYTVYAVPKEISSINEIAEDIDILDLCINPTLGLTLLQECKKSFQCIVIQPGAESEELLAYLRQNSLPYLRGCLLAGLNLYR